MPTRISSSIGYPVATVGLHNQLSLVKESKNSKKYYWKLESRLWSVLHHVITLSTMTSMAPCIRCSRSPLAKPLPSVARHSVAAHPCADTWLLCQEEARSTLEVTVITFAAHPPPHIDPVLYCQCCVYKCTEFYNEAMSKYLRTQLAVNNFWF
jgi:hypothetical protein